MHVLMVTLVRELQRQQQLLNVIKTCIAWQICLILVQLENMARPKVWQQPTNALIAHQATCAQLITLTW